MRQVTITSLLVLLVVFLASFVFREELESRASDLIDDYGVVALFCLSLLLEMVPQYVAPQLLAFGAPVWGFSFLVTFASLYLGSVVGSWIGFELGVRYRDRVLARVVSGERRDRVAGLVERYGRWGLVLTATTPLPYIPVVLGTLPLNRRQFAIYGVVPRAIYFLYATGLAFWVL